MFNKIKHAFILVFVVTLFGIATTSENTALNLTDDYSLSQYTTSLDNAFSNNLAQNSLAQNNLVQNHSVKNNEGLLITSTQASQFSHVKQTNVNYLFMIIIAFFSAFFVVFYRLILPVLPKPWYLSTRISANSRLCGWQESNLLYKAKLTFEL